MKKLIASQDPLFSWVIQPNYLYQYGLEIGIKSESLLEGTGLTIEDIDDVDLYINWEQYRDLAINVGRHGPADWGFQFGKKLNVTSHGLISLLMMNCENWGQLLQLLEDYPVLLSPIFYVSRKETQEYVFLNVNPEFTRHPVLRRSMEAFFTMFYQGLRDLGAVEMVQQSEIVKIFVKEEEPSYAELLREFFHDNISWGNYANQIRIAKSILDVKVPNANPITASATRKILQSQLAQLKASKGGLNELRSLFDLGCYKQDECAKQMLTTLPTLKRFLKLAYTTFSDELKYYRLDEACWAAQNTDLSMAQLLDELGFQDANSFARLFKGEMGTTFNQFRSEKKG